MHGSGAIGEAISHSCELARYLTDALRTHPETFELAAPSDLNIVLLSGFGANDSDEVNREIVMRLQEQGLAAPSTTEVDGRLAIRAALFNHRTSRADIDVLINATIAIGRSITGSCAAMSVPHPPAAASQGGAAAPNTEGPTACC